MLYQAPKREITAVAVAKDGAIYAAGVGNKTLTVPSPAPAPPPAPANVVIAGPSMTAVPVHISPPPSFGAGGEPPSPEDLKSIASTPTDRRARVWSNSQDIVYAIAFDSNGQPLLGTGNRGKIYRLDSDVISTELLDASPTQVTGFGRGSNGELYAVTGNIGRVYRVGPGLEKSGSFESEILDASSFSYWGRISYRGKGNIAVLTRSGNLNRPESNWSPWARLTPDSARRSHLRFLRRRPLQLPCRSLLPVQDRPCRINARPEVSFVEIAYIAKNEAPTCG